MLDLFAHSAALPSATLYTARRQLAPCCARQPGGMVHGVAAEGPCCFAHNPKLLPACWCVLVAAEADAGRAKKQKRDKKREKDQAKQGPKERKRKGAKAKPEAGSSDEEEEEEQSEGEQRGGRRRGAHGWLSAAP